jgi:hypothetical protein
MRIIENLNENGVLALSTPCAHSETQLRPEWWAHKIEYSATDLKKLLRLFFEEVLLPEERTLPNLEFWEMLINKDKVRYLNLANPILCIRPRRVLPVP